MLCGRIKYVACIMDRNDIGDAFNCLNIINAVAVLFSFKPII